MKTLDFSSVIYGVAQLAGHDRDTLPTHFVGQVRDWADQRIEVAWESENWIEVTRYAQLSVATGGDGAIYAPVPSDAGEIFDVYDGDPRVSTRTLALPYSLYQDTNGIRIQLARSSSAAWCWYRIERPQLTGDIFSDTETYLSGEQVYFEDDGVGNFYDCIVNTSAGESPTTTPSSWSRIEIPKIFQLYLIRACFADYMTAQQQHDVALRQEDMANSALMKEADKLHRQQGAVPRFRMIQNT